jgi:peptide chain release factor 1
MFEELASKKKRFTEIQHLLSDPKVIADGARYQKLAKEMASLKEIVEKYDTYREVMRHIKDSDALLKAEGHHEELAALAREELRSLNQKKESLEHELIDILHQNPYEDKDIIMEIRAGTGGLEASLFAADLFRMYSRYVARRGWKLELLNSNITEKGGFKEVIFSVAGKGVYGDMQYESGTHRVQRVPVTEASGRIHTSAATVAVLPEAEEVDIGIDPKDLQVDVFRAGGRGGQHVNVTDSAVRITHKPTGIVVSCQDERSQHKNKAKAMRVLRTRIMDAMMQEQHRKRSAERKSQIGSGDRSEKIRTYNFPDSRVTDHRIGLTLHKLEAILEGDLDEVVAALKAEERKLKMQGKGFDA